DASDMPAYANGQRFLYNGGPERQVYSDPDASWGHRSAVSTRKGGGFYGYRVHAAVCARTGLPLAWQVETARSHESNYVAPLLDALRARGFEPATPQWIWATTTRASTPSAPTVTLCRSSRSARTAASARRASRARATSG